MCSFSYLNCVTKDKKCTALGKELQISQTDVDKNLETSVSVISRYERDEMTQSKEVAAKMAVILEVSLDYLVGKTNLELDTSMLKRVEAVSNLPSKEKETVYLLLDSFLDRMKLQGVL